MKKEEISRRKFLQTTGGAVAATALGATAEVKAAPKRKRFSANDKVVLGFIGVAGRGYGAHMQTFGQMEDVEIGAVCDVYQPYVDRAVKFTDGKAKAYHDFRKLLEQKDIDAVVVATPPHWHAIISILACEAGKDVYCEKPMSRYPMEALMMARAARVYKRVTQVGTQIHATENYHRCVNIVRSGALGPITAVTNICTMNDDSEGLDHPADSEPLPGLDWDFWLGPAPKVPFNIGRFRDGMHRYFKDYVNSWLHELGPHIVDLPVWALELGAPLAVSASGGRFATTSIADVPDTLHVIWEYPNMNMTWVLMQQSRFNFGVGEMGPYRQLGIIFHGKDATLIANYDLCQVIDKNGKPVERTDYPVVVPPSPGHWREFIDCIKTRQQPSCNFEAHLPLHLALNLAHTSLYANRKIHWDNTKFEVIGDREANHLLMPPYRAPWKLPVVKEASDTPG
ncbi:MAG TPA: Gfo/Idh/MocA family oxidoreductase [Chthonomonas sp.]|uniref:Gfo/Idh/MocA family oxidoreductase n=1 Tax=Chthonomonas sp. TaxID=2282153 RepID=UPI002B4AC8F7|nr:Gfo/Idh/MocA family oxidoreductase [Chthonomonas sp.]HLI48649.1 Gfo/Idh/MocA family oxidoreductase [Chthonomonas sp.]